MTRPGFHWTTFCMSNKFTKVENKKSDREWQGSPYVEAKKYMARCKMQMVMATSVGTKHSHLTLNCNPSKLVFCPVF